MPPCIPAARPQCADELSPLSPRDTCAGGGAGGGEAGGAACDCAVDDEAGTTLAAATVAPVDAADVAASRGPRSVFPEPRSRSSATATTNASAVTVSAHE